MSFMSEVISETLREVTAGLDDGRYSLVGTLREGRLYLAERAGKRFLLKTAADARGLELLKREYELSVGLSHAGLAYVFTWEEESPVGPCIVQEYVDGRTLGEFLSEKPDARQRRRLFRELLDVVGCLHRRGVIHNDLKPDNLLVSRADDSLKLIDLGFADDAGHLAHSLGGTRGYASPELLSGETVDARSDIYSLGVLLRECFPGRYRGIVRRCLQADPARRYGTVAELEKALRHHRRPLWTGLILAAALLLGLFSYSYIHMRAELRETAAQWAVLRDADAARQEAEAAERDALAEAKAAVDAWYDSEIPAFRDAMRQAASQKALNDAWTALVDRMSVLNVDIPASLPEPLRPAFRDYLFERYSAVFPDLQEEMIARNDDLPAVK